MILHIGKTVRHEVLCSGGSAAMGLQGTLPGTQKVLSGRQLAIKARCAHTQHSPDKGSDVGPAPVHQVPPATDRQCHNGAAADEIVLRCPPADAAGAAEILVAGRQ